MPAPDPVAAARRWLGTPWAHQQCCPGAGVDCVQLVAAVGRECGLLPADLVAAGYDRQPTGELLAGRLMEHLEPVPLEQARPGDVLQLRLGSREANHLAILTAGSLAGGPASILHAYSRHAVVEHPLDARWRQRVRAAWRFRSPGE